MAGAPEGRAQTPDRPGAESRTQVEQEALRDVAGTDLQGADGPLRRVGFALAQLHHAYRAHRVAGKAGATFASPVPFARVREGTVAVDAIARGDDASQLLADLRALGLKDGAAAGRLVSGRLPLSAIPEAARLSSLHSARPVLPVRRIGSTTSQGVEAIRSDGFREETGATGAGARVGILSDSYDNSRSASTTAVEDVRSGDLPGPANPNGFTQPVQVVEDADQPESDEGRALAQIVHDIAPGTELLFHSAFNGGSVNFADAIRTLAAEGATVIVDDVLFPGEPMFQDGIIAQSVDDVVFGDGVPHVTSAGNNGRSSYESPYRASGRQGPVGGDLHDFDPGPSVDTLQTIRVPAGTTVQVALHWNQPSASTGGEGARSDLEVFLLDSAGRIVAEPQRRPNAGGNPFEFTTYENTSSASQTLGIGIERVSGPAPSLMKYVLFEEGGNVERLEYDDPAPTLYGHANAQGAIAVGAAAYFNTPPFNDNVEAPVINNFSSVGGIPILFDELGRPVPGDGVQRDNPDLTAPDGVNTTFFGSDLDGNNFPAEDDTFPNFFGTSAAAPHVAGLIALLQEGEPGLSPRAYADALRQSAVDVRRTSEGVETGVGPDPFSGAGFVNGAQIQLQVPTVDQFTAEVSPEQSNVLAVTWREQDGASVGRYVVERSFLGTPFQPVDTVASEGAGTYRVRQENLEPGIYDFRLRIGRNGTLEVGPRTRGRVRVQGKVVVKGPYPNPTPGTFRIRLTVPQSQGVVLALYDALGRRVGIVERTFLRADRPQLTRIDESLVDRFGSGLYFVRIVGEEFDTAVPVTFVR